MAVLKHIVSKNANYGESLDYLLFQHDERTKKPILNEHVQITLKRNASSATAELLFHF